MLKFFRFYHANQRSCFCRKEAYHDIRHRLRPLRHCPDGKKPRRPPWLHLCGQGLRPGGAGGAGAFGGNSSPLSAHKAASAAADFAAKEAFLKAAGTGLAGPFALCEIEAVRLESGAPEYRFSGGSARWMDERHLRAKLSLSHDGGMALAFCILETET
ncbi:MAG: holo-ACP synthase [Faecalibacterium prausnitzii]